jgi:hypothetical protein
MPAGGDSGIYRIVAASIEGGSHMKSQRGCDDALAFYQKDDVLVGVVADGAGSAKNSAAGAKRIAAAVTHCLRRFPCQNPFAAKGAAIEASDARLFVEEIVRTARTAIVDSARAGCTSAEQSDDHILRSYHATVSGVVMTGSDGFLFQIGDGLSAVCGSDCWSFDGEWYHPPQCLLPENGEYANQAWFYTMSDWAEHLRICLFKDAEAVLLMTDGVTPFVVDGAGRLDWWFIGPLLRHVRDTSPQAAAEALTTVLSTGKSELIDDDKTMLIVLRSPSGKSA